MQKLNDINSEISLEKKVLSSDVPISFFRLRWSALVEIIVFLAVLFLIDFFFLDGTRYRDVQPHPFWVMILLISAQYGTRMGVISAIAASAMFVIGNVPEQSLDQDMHQWFFYVFKLPILWLVTSVIIGEIIVRRISMHQHLDEQLSRYIKREASLLKSFNMSNLLKEKLEVRIAGQSSTVRKTLKAAREMEDLEPMQALLKGQVLVESMLEPDKFSIYILKNNQLELLSEHGWKEKDNYLRNFDVDDSLYKSVVVDWKILNVSNIDDETVLDEQGVLAGPLIIPKSGEVFGMLKIEKLNFSQFSSNTIMDFNSICQWVGSVYGNSIQRD